ncbi:restriction endonuclease subunit S [Campylobacter sp. CLAX-7218-21]|uniref:restriction endonuclease subunit S n=1 Tax=Campylobacter devanensis TaxID=3161138 RepID=UPI002E9C542E|nr:restriction endonuclease subunit S [Campylobacter sp. CLAX-7218-21]
MSKLEELINKLCPNGVEFISLETLFKQFSGMTGVSNKWKEIGNCKFIDYMNAYKNLKIDVSRLENATVKKLEQNKLAKGDILLTSASETPDECALSSVIEKDIIENVFMDDHLFGIRLKDEYKTTINTSYINYYMHTNQFRKDVFKAVRGVTRFYISVDTFMKIKVAVPPLEVQCEIVRILDNFTLLSAELSAELSARQKQYEYYKEILLEKKLSDKVRLGDCLLKVENIKWKQTNDTHLYIDLSSVDREKHRIINTTKINKSNAPSRAQQIVKTNDVLFGGTRPMLKRSCLIEKQYNNEICSTGFCVLRANTDKILPKWIYFMISTNSFYNYVEQNQKGASYPAITDGAIKDYEISLPSLKEQEKMVELLDKFEKYNNDMFEGLPAEIEARKKQYEYYRDKLLTFKELKDNE